MIYRSIIKPLLFQMPAEKAHYKVFSWLRISLKSKVTRSIVRKSHEVKHPTLQKECFGLKFDNPVGLAAGFDKDAKLFEELSCFGFGFIEIGTLTPNPQDGNPKPRLFRLPKDEALINRMGFNNEGVEAAVNRLKKRNPKLIIGGNIGKNKVTPNDEALSDYLKCFHALFDYVDYFVVNVSSPNTPNLRELQEKEPLTKLLQVLKDENVRKNKQKPILLKIAPDLTDSQLLDIIDIVNDTKIDGVIATNTTISREGLTSKNKEEVGGLSGKPLTSRSTEVIRFLSEKSNKAFPIIGVGGIHSANDALEKLDAGADLIQLYTGFIYEGPKLIKDINKAILKRR